MLQTINGKTSVALWKFWVGRINFKTQNFHTFQTLQKIIIFPSLTIPHPMATMH